MAPDDTELAERIRAGDEGAFEALFREYYTLLTGYAYSILRSGDSARDVVSDLFAHIWEQRASWNPHRHPHADHAGHASHPGHPSHPGIRSYLLAAVRNRALNIIRDDARRNNIISRYSSSDEFLYGEQGAAGKDSDIAAEMDRAEQIDKVNAAISAMRGVRREVMVMRWREQMSVPEIASALGISTNSVSSHLSQALKALRAELNEDNRGSGAS